MVKKIGLFLLVVLFLGVSIVPVTNAYKGSIAVALPQEPPTMDPNITTNAIGFMLWSWSYDTLVKYDMLTKTVKPWLVDKWEKVNPTTVKFHIREDAVFADGSPVTSQAVVFSYNRVHNPKLKSRQRVYYKSWKKIEIVDAKNFILHLKYPNNGMFGMLSRVFSITNPKAAAKGKGEGKRYLARNTMGSGPYLLKSWSKGTKMVFEANPKWWGNKDYPNRPKTVVMRRITEQTTKVKALLKGEVDIVSAVEAHLLPQISSHPNTKVAIVPATRIFFVSFADRFGGPMTDINVRKALNYAIDADKIRTTIMKGNVDPYHSMYHPWTHSGYDPDHRWYGYDLAKAKEYLKKSAYPNGFKVEIVNTRGRFAYDAKVTEAIGQMVAKLGIDVKIKAVNFPLYKKTVVSYGKKKQKRAGIVMRSWGNTFFDTSSVVSATGSCTGPWSVVCNKEVDKMDKAASAMADPKAQDKAFKAVTAKMKENAMHKILYKLKQTFGLQKNISFNPQGNGTLNVWEVVRK
ncbi:MAG: hypothetical protein HOC91_10720 [Nitrospinaceae bacterium]|jgi:peptide/nickel transport system substrate-binding protein|nr:hypothetical protein [Nitrospinaceae bacterium]MBT3822498.1 hypothetical protein [Nitrospinaceae bacterium]MBT4093649.1 hypothetical protein [Nitrospinaceae bacterium]MBT4430978.1 hypothetical protein [Nitrospinaceae bacterium]MBT5369422.1 hypothetical protein [Nitrospinaceae bacterium]